MTTRHRSLRAPRAHLGARSAATAAAVIAALAASAALAAPTSDATGPVVEVVGGTVAPPGAWPSTVSFQYKGLGAAADAHGCGGTLISPRDILTAAHCAEGWETKYHNTVLIGAQHLQKRGEPLQGKQYAIAWTAQHPIFSDSRYRPTDYDVAVLRLAEPVVGIAPMRIVKSIKEEAAIAAPGTVAWTAGWGSMGGASESTPDLRQVDVPIVGAEACRNAGDLYGDFITPRMICAGGVKGKDSCTGDSGGPLIVHTGPNNEPVQVGIVSWGTTQACGLQGQPAMYTRIAAVRQWIQQQLDRP